MNEYLIIGIIFIALISIAVYATYTSTKSHIKNSFRVGIINSPIDLHARRQIIKMIDGL